MQPFILLKNFVSARILLLSFFFINLDLLSYISAGTAIVLSNLNQ